MQGFTRGFVVLLLVRTVRKRKLVCSSKEVFILLYTFVTI